MAVSLFKLVVSVNANPTIRRYMYRFDSDQRTGANAIFIKRSMFQNDTGGLMTANLPVVNSSNGYYMLFINGVPQQKGLFEVGAAGTGVRILSGGASLGTNTPIVLTVNNFAASSPSN